MECRRDLLKATHPVFGRKVLEAQACDSTWECWGRVGQETHWDIWAMS